MPDNKFYLAQLPAENQKHIRHCIKLVSGFLRQAESRLSRYESENAEATTDSVFKTIEDLKYAIALAEGMLSELVKAHRLPEELTLVPDKYRKDFRDLLRASD